VTANPLMLSTLCLAHHADTRLPEQRGEARAFARWLTGELSGVVARLPTEAEWEFLASRHVTFHAA
jgi:hypothetical protein